MSSRELDIPDGMFDLDINALPREEREFALEKLYNVTVFKRSFEHEPTLS